MFLIFLDDIKLCDVDEGVNCWVGDYIFFCFEVC